MFGSANTDLMSGLGSLLSGVAAILTVLGGIIGWWIIQREKELLPAKHEPSEEPPVSEKEEKLTPPNISGKDASLVIAIAKSVPHALQLPAEPTLSVFALVLAGALIGFGGGFFLLAPWTLTPISILAKIFIPSASVFFAAQLHRFATRVIREHVYQVGEDNFRILDEVRHKLLVNGYDDAMPLHSAHQRDQSFFGEEDVT